MSTSARSIIATIVRRGATGHQLARILVAGAPQALQRERRSRASAVEEGYPQSEIARSAFEFQRDVDTKRRAIVGVNKYQTPGEEDHIPTLKIEHAVESNQIERIKAFRGTRDAAVSSARSPRSRRRSRTTSRT